MTSEAARQGPEPKGKTRRAESTSGPAPKKRRKRTVVSGASDDCFACSKRGARCDRRRPYCTQCLDLGRECSGYKTTLTWGVGVASRGKLRGQKLPVMESGNALSGSAAKSEPPATSSTPSHPAPAAPVPTMASTEPPPPQTAPDGSEMSNNLAWTMDMPDPHTWSNASAAPPKISGLPSPNRPVISNQPASTLAVDTSPQYAPGSSPTYATATPTWQVANPWLVQNVTPPSQETDEEEIEDLDHSIMWNAGNQPSLSQLLLARSVGRTPRLRYLISYYSEVIAPMIVAFDTPTNPFRTHVLRLAQESEALQEAIATLATSNLRQRRLRNHTSTERTLPARMSSLAHRALTDEAFQDRYGISVPEGYAREENYHRGMAVKALNADLADSQRRLSDSVLATLLILCLFHGCDTGVAEFRTQFAGVTRLLAIRMRHSPIITEEMKWFIRMFSWFDTLTATTNDRDVQLRGACLDISSRTDGEWGLENLAGCDGRLFKLISQLGRLNILSQDQQSEVPASTDVSVATTSLPPNMLHPGWEEVVPASGTTMDASFGMPFPIIQNTDLMRRPSSPDFWTEWYSLRQRLESWRFDPPTESSFSSSPMDASAMSWNTTNYLSPPSSPIAPYTVTPENLQDVFQISECFRHAALLYCERLAEPSLPSRHPRIQHIVQLAMHCICAVQSDVYLLWPLFIVGSECVQDDHRTTIRNRCKDISKDSGFVNNLSCLELLEKIWSEHSDESSFPVYPADLDPSQLPGPPTAQAFRWSRVMQAKRGDGEYMVA
ncbi:hypothetical protein N7510_004217 [Penicillium lagena]|uniref:uncharacterized protein n=1 Tax=Penicillium lagena TaxID=94218 RepID=UPI002541BD5E|nr:uncharacterized protein N7510_004217 [Penicillium lagena]KAJ5620233.1 hypothetical protein N7510_004217 [Penicillium lagena]